MAGLIAFFLLSIAVILQNTIVTRMNMLSGAADLVLLVLLSWVLQSDENYPWHWGLIAGGLIGVSSALPFWLPMIGYTVVIGAVFYIQKRVWQVPLWLLLISTFVGSLAVYGIEVVYLWVIGVPLDLLEVFNIVIIPSIVLNMLVVFPIYGLIGEVVKIVNPKEVDV